MAAGLRASGRGVVLSVLFRPPSSQPQARGKLLSLPVPLFLRWMILCYCEGPAR